MSNNALEIEAGGNGHMMQMRFGQPTIGGAPQARRAHSLRDRAFDGRPQGVLLHKGGGVLHLATLQQGGMHLGGREGERACASPLPMGTLGAGRTAAAGGRRKADDHRGLLASIRWLCPADTLLPLWTGRHLPWPIEAEVLGRIAALLAL